jgi:hypothetical protein
MVLNLADDSSKNPYSTGVEFIKKKGELIISRFVVVNKQPQHQKILCPTDNMFLARLLVCWIIYIHALF